VTSRRHGFGQDFAGIRFVEQRLPLQVARLDVIPVDHDEPTHPGARQGIRLSGSERATARNHGRRCEQAFLALFANLGEENLPRVALFFVCFQQRFVSGIMILSAAVFVRFIP